MQLRILAVGRAKAGPEKALTEDYLVRLSGLGKTVALGPASLTEIDPRKADADTILDRAGTGTRIVALDERGKSLPSLAFSQKLCDWRDDDPRETVFLIGGADGHDQRVRERAELLLSFGLATWPHMLVRAMLAEQLYRAVAIAANHPYHREG